jgi:2-polyprenyl-3-methyl-5-hydroxy-6-metoxy-1,4-benzoquinol methylase
MTTPCSYCGTGSELLFRSRDYNRNVTRDRFDHYLCPSCGLIFIYPIPSNLGDYYPRTYYSVPESTGALDAGTAHERYKIEIIQRHVPRGRLLEIGPSLGCFAYLAKQSGFETEAIEMDSRCSEFLNRVAGIPTVNSSHTVGALESLDPFDVVALWHVIEHLPDPWETLEAISAKLKPGGILVLAAPNPDAFQFRVLGRYWPHLDAPRHLMLIPSRVLIEKMAMLGMKVEMTTTTDEGGLGWNVFGWEHLASRIGSSGLLNRVAQFLGRTLARVLSPIERVEGKGSAYTLVFRKGS